MPPPPLHPCTTRLEIPTPTPAPASSDCHRIRVWLFPRLAVLVKVGKAVSVLVVGGTTPTTVHDPPLSVEMETVTFDFEPPP